MSALISIIIPVYNTQPYLRRCLDSIKNQGFCDYEVIMIDDGSTDGSKEICWEYARLDSRFRLIEFFHSGCAESRNLGLQEAVGRYVTFVDSDDYVTSSYLSDLYRYMAVNEGVDMVAQGLTRIVGNKSEVRGTFSEQVFCLPEYSSSFFRHFSVVTSGSVCAKLFRADLIKAHNLIFHPEVKLAEDMGFLIEYLFHSSVIALDPNLDYYYIGNPVSASTCYWNFSTEESAYRILSALWERLLNKYPSEELKSDYSVFVGNYVNRMVFTNILHASSPQEKIKNFERLKRLYYPGFSSNHKAKSLFTKLLKFSALHSMYRLYALLMQLAIWRYGLSVNCK